MDTPGIGAPAQTPSRWAGIPYWLGQRGRDAVRWPAELVRELPARAGRLGQGVDDGARGVARFPAAAHAAWRAGGRRALPPFVRQDAALAGLWVLRFATRFFDLFGGPELAEILLHAITYATPLTTEEREAAAAVLGPTAVRWSDVRVVKGGVLEPIFRRNGNRAYTTWHTINLPATGAHVREHVDILVHELVHVLQFERTGSAYIVEALHAQCTAAGYDYGGPEQLLADWLAGRRRYGEYNREQQAQIVQDYFNLLRQQPATSEALKDREDRLACYGPCLIELHAGLI